MKIKEHQMQRKRVNNERIAVDIVDNKDIEESAISRCNLKAIVKSNEPSWEPHEGPKIHTTCLARHYFHAPKMFRFYMANCARRGEILNKFVYDK